MVHQLYHFRSERRCEDLQLSSQHRVAGKLVQFLTDFQLDGVRFLYKNFESNQGCILNDESGLGKIATVVSFLSAVLPLDGTKRCLIIAKDMGRISNWQFHLDALTKLHVKLLQAEKDIESDNVYLVTWEILRKSPNLARTLFNCVILDDRGDLTSSKICLNFFLKNFENRISLIMASTDVTLDIKQFHGLLKLCGHLDKKYEKLSVFEEKFSLPKPEGKSAGDRALLEAYFQRREKIINYCREFRLRRYRHQFEESLPLTNSTAFSKSLEEWKEKCLAKSSSLSSGSVKIISSSSEKNTEELFQTYFDVKSEKLLDDEIRKINASAVKHEIHNQPADTVEMSPLLFESDTEDIIPPKCVQGNRRSTRRIVSSPEPSTIESTEKKPDTQRRPRKSRKPNTRDVVSDKQIIRNLRSTVRRTKSQPNSTANRKLALEISRMIEQTDAQQKKQRKIARRSAPVKLETAHEKSDDDEVVIDETQHLTELRRNTNAKTFNTEFSPIESSYNFNVDLLNKPLPPDSSEVHFCTQQPNQVIVISSSNEYSGATNGRTRFMQSEKISPSPDIFENYDEYDFLCTQRGKSAFTGFKMFGRDSKDRSQQKPKTSCLDNLEKSYRSRTAKIDVADSDEPNAFEITRNDVFDNMVQIHAELNTTPYNSKNKITKYLSSSQSFDSSQTIPTDDSLRRDGENYPKTPKRQLVGSQKSLLTLKKSPKAQRSASCVTPTGLTKWLIKKTPEDGARQDPPTKSTKRKRLDLWFND